MKRRIKVCSLAITVFMAYVFAGCQKVSRVSKDNIKVDFNGIEFNAEDEDYAQSGFGTMGRMARGAEGYYFMDFQLIKYYDIKQGKSVILCNKPDCKHEISGKSECYAYSKSSHIFYHRGYLYQDVIDSDKEYTLVRMDLDGTNRKDIGKLGQQPNNMAFCNGYVYYEYESGVTGEESVSCLYRMSLEDGAVETCYEYKGKNGDFGKMNVYGDKLFFVITEVETNEYGGYKTVGKGLYCIDGQTGKVSLITDEDINSYCYDYNNNIFYLYKTGDGLYRYDIGSSQSEKIFNADNQTLMVSLSYDGEKVYMSNCNWKVYATSFYKLETPVECKIWVFNDKEIEVEIPLNELGSRPVELFGDKDGLFVSGSKGTEKGIFMADKKNLSNIEWKKL